MSGSRRRSTANLIARSRSSSGYFLGAGKTLILPWNESLHQTRNGTLTIAGHEHTAADPLTDTARDVISATGTDWPNTKAYGSGQTWQRGTHWWPQVYSVAIGARNQRFPR
ncbi:hypothetical protein GCM10009826_11000 [Humibacillus xanthopallidus]